MYCWLMRTSKGGITHQDLMNMQMAEIMDYQKEYNEIIRKENKAMKNG